MLVQILDGQKGTYLGNFFSKTSISKNFGELNNAESTTTGTT